MAPMFEIGVTMFPEHYGFVILVVIAHIIILQYMAAMVVRARKIYGVEYPDMYAIRGLTSRAQPAEIESSSDAPLLPLSDADCNAFNCYQRAHQNTLEQTPQFLILLTLSGIHFPITATCAGLVFIIGRIAYAQGYYTGKPAKRHWGAFSLLGLAVLLGLAFAQAVILLKHSS